MCLVIQMMWIRFFIIIEAVDAVPFTNCASIGLRDLNTVKETNSALDPSHGRRCCQGLSEISSGKPSLLENRDRGVFFGN